MPPDDDLFSSEGEPQNSDTTPQGTSAATPPPGVTQEDLERFAQQFVEPNTAQMAQITQNQTDLTAAVKAISDRIGMSGEPPNGANPEVDVSDFLTNPTQHIEDISKGVVSNEVREQVAPLLAQLVQQTYNQNLQHQETTVDTEFGKGAWKEHFWPELKPIFDRTQKEAPSQLGNTEAMQRAVDAVKGAKFGALAEAREGALKSTAERLEAEKNDLREYVTSNLTGGISRQQGKAVLTDEMKDYIEREYRATGVKPDEAGFLASVQSGTTLADWEEAQAAGKKE